VNTEFDGCLKRHRIKEFSRGTALVGKELKTAEQDFLEAKESFTREKYKWSTVQVYYAMFHCARALLYEKNYREQSHYCLIVAVRALYVDKKLLSHSLIESLQRAKTLRENADYYDNWSKDAAKSILESAEEFLTAAKKILTNK